MYRMCTAGKARGYWYPLQMGKLRLRGFQSPPTPPQMFLAPPGFCLPPPCPLLLPYDPACAVPGLAPGEAEGKLRH